MKPGDGKGMTKEGKERREALLQVRGEILVNYQAEKDQRMYWLVRLMDVEDELEELARKENQRTILENFTSAGNSRRRSGEKVGIVKRH